ncbi:hypothetical protein MLD38_011558 [Melastoma candidum]|uniref:Uncharacterized protein n=1 Tax=Melastoma candidum TaxID=119954 RepID=A0ACB9RBT4_9MYRT|nr:hypothetical protein MLD38_011558 [Melastoma candidum]
MESKKQMGSSPPSSLSPDIFGVKESSPGAPAGVFASIFPPPQMVVGRRSSSDFIGSQQKQSFGTQAWSSKHGDPATRSENGSSSKPFKDGAVMFTPSPLGIRPQALIQCQRKMGLKMIRMGTTPSMHPEEIGGKVHFITRMLLFQRRKDSATIFEEFRGLKK